MIHIMNQIKSTNIILFWFTMKMKTINQKVVVVVVFSVSDFDVKGYSH